MAISTDAIGTMINTGSGTSASDTGSITVGGSATLITIALVLTGGNATSGYSAGWNALSATFQPTASVAFTTNGFVSVSFFTLLAPAAGSNNLFANWTGAATSYLGAISWKGTDTSLGIYVPDNVTATSVASGAQSLAVNTDASGGTLVVITNDGGGTPTILTQTEWYIDNNEDGNSAGSYGLGGSGTNTHNFGGSASATCTAMAGMHIIAPGYSPPGGVSFPLPTQIYVMP